MKSLYVILTSCLLTGLLSPLLTLPASAANTPRVLLSEVGWGGSRLSTADEYLELANGGGDGIDLSGWQITGAGSSGASLTLPSGSIIPSYSTFLIANYAPGTSSTLAVKADYVTTAISLPNSKLTLTLLDSSGLTVDSLVDAGTPDFGSTSPIYSSMERNLETLAWQSALTSQNLTDATQLGTPGFANIAIPSPVVAVPEIVEPVVEPTPTITPDVIAETPIISDVVETPIIEPSQSSTLTADPTTELSSAPDFIIDDTQTPIVTTEPTIDPPVIDETPITPAVVVDPSTIIAEPVAETPFIDSPIIDKPITEAISVPAPTTPLPSYAPTPPSSGHIVLSEFLPSPSTGFDEWVEIYNADSTDIDVSAWHISDASGKQTSLTGTLAAGAYQTIVNPSGKLNNDGDTINLLDATGNLIDSVTYGTTAIPAPKHDVSLSFSDNTWLISDTATPGAANLVTITPATTEVTSDPVIIDEPNITPIVNSNIDESPVPSTPSIPTSTTTTTSTVVKLAATSASPSSKTTTKKSVSKSTSTKKTSSTKAAAKTKSSIVTLSGTVIATPGTFGKQLAFISGTELYLNKADWPTLALGDVITVSGTYSTSRGEQRLKLTNANSITLIGHADVTSGSLTDAAASTLVTVHGTVVTRNGSKLALLVDGQNISVEAYKTSGLIWSKLTSSDLIITGVLRHINNEDILMPRNQADVVEDHDAVISAAAVTQHSNPLPLKPIAGGGLVMSTLGSLGYWFKKSKTLIPSV